MIPTNPNVPIRTARCLDPRLLLLDLSLAVACLMPLGCMMTGPAPDRDVRMTRGYIYYCDGAGGGGLITNWGRGVKQGFADAGYDGAGEIFAWETGLGAKADQESSLEYKRGKARELARSIAARRQQYRGVPITVMGLSAGTAVAVFALEELPPSASVDNVVLMGASISANYDLTRALQRVRNKFYVFSSEHDAVLLYAVPLSVTADNEDGSVMTAGLHGFQRPAHMSADARSQYAKLVHIDWQPEFAALGHGGGHTDVVNPKFVSAYVAPLVMKAEHYAGAPVVATAGRVPNPDFERWSRFGEGTTIVFEGEQFEDGERQRIRVQVELTAKHRDKLVIERRYLGGDNFDDLIRVQSYFAEPTIRPEDNPLTHPTARVEQLADQMRTVRGQQLRCNVQSVSVDAGFDDWGRNLRATLYRNESVPGGIAAVELLAHRGSKPYEFSGTLVDYRVKPK